MVRQEMFADFLDEYLGDGWRYDVDLTAQRIVFASPTAELTARAHLLASVAARPASLMWGWSPAFASQAGPDPAAARFREFGQQHGVSELLTEEVPYDTPPGRDQKEYIADLCHDVGAAATVVFGPDTLYYSIPTGNGVSRIVMLLDSFSAPVPRAGMTDVFVRLPRLLAAVDEVAWSLDGLARFSPGWRLDPGHVIDRTHDYRLVDETGAWAQVFITYGPGQRIEGIRVNGVHQPGAEPPEA